MIMLARLASRLGVAFGLAALLGLLPAGRASAQQLTLPSDPLGAGNTPLLSQGSSTIDGGATVIATDVGAAPNIQQTSGTLYNPLTGSHIRAQYNTESYGQAEGNLNLGTMLLRRIDGGVGFFDGQVTMNDESRVGYNLGLGYRWLTLPVLPNSPDDQKIMGVSLWADGQMTDGENFFPQIGTSLELLGDRVDFRANGYAVLGDRTQSRDFVGTGETVFTENFLAERTIGVLDTALTVAEMELAGRIYDQEAWLFGGVYGFKGGAFDSVGGKIGLRGYLTPDLNLSVAITHDDVFDTNGVMRLTWFIGRTRRENCPCGTLQDRFREPVIRNDYIAMAESQAFGTQNTILDANGDPVRIVHVDSTAGAGGDGTFENPLSMLGDVKANSLEGDTILVHADSVFSGDGVMLMDDQDLFGEGGGRTNSVATADGPLTLPETAAGALNGAIPTINDSPVAGVILADDNTVNNLAFDGGMAAITSDAMTPDSSANPTLTNLTVANTMGDAIVLNNQAVADEDDVDNDGDTAETVARLGTVTIDNVDFTGVAGRDISVDAATTADIVQAETVSVTNITSTGNAGLLGQSLAIENTNGVGVGAVTVDEYQVDGAGVRLNANQNIASLTNLTVTNVTTGPGVDISDAMAATTVSSSSIDGVAGTDAGIRVNGNTAVVNIGAAGDNGEVTIANAAGAGLSVTGAEAAVNFDNGSSITGGGDGVTVTATLDGGDVSIGTTASITDVGGKAVVTNNTIGAVTVDADLVNDSQDGGGVSVTDNTGAVAFNGLITTQNTKAVEITGAMNAVNFSGDITSVGTGDTITITNVVDGDVTFNNSVTNDAVGRVLVVDGGDENIVFNNGTNTITDEGDGVDIFNRGGGADSLVNFLATTTLTTGGDSLRLGTSAGGANATDSVVRFADLTIENSGGVGSAAILGEDLGELNILAGSINATGDAAAIDLDTGSSSQGLTFSSVDVASGAQAIVLNDFDGNVTVNGGTLTTDGAMAAVDVTDSGLALNGVSINPTNAGGSAVSATYTAASTRTVTIDGQGTASFNDGDVDFTTQGNAAQIISVMNVDDIGATSFVSNSTGSSSLALASLTTSGGFDFDVTNSGNLTVTADDVVSTAGNTDIDVTGAGDFSGMLTDFQTAGELQANTAPGSAGDLTVDADTNTGATEFTGVDVNDQGDGAVDVTLDGVETDTTGIAFASAGGGAATLTVMDGDYAGGVTFNASNTAAKTLDISGGQYDAAINASASGAGTSPRWSSGRPRSRRAASASTRRTKGTSPPTSPTSTPRPALYRSPPTQTSRT